MKIPLIILMSSLLFACNQQKAPEEPVIRPIAWTKVEAFNLSQLRRLSGSLQAVEAADLSFQVGGKVAEVHVNLGDRVTKNSPLATLDQKNAQLVLNGAKAQLQQAKSSFTEAENEFKRYAELAEKKLVSQSGYDNARAAYELAKSAVEVAETQWSIAEKDMQDTVLRSPYDGNITKRLIEPSQQVSAGQTVFVIEGEHGLEINVLVPENLVQQLPRNTAFDVRFPSSRGLALKAVISEVGVRAVSANSFPVTLTLLQQSDELRAGMTAEIDFTFEGEGISGYRGETIKLPVSAIAPGKGEAAFVFVYDEATGQVAKRAIKTENILNNEVLISEGLKPGEIVAIAGVAFLRDGQKVTLLDPTTKRFN